MLNKQESLPSRKPERNKPKVFSFRELGKEGLQVLEPLEGALEAKIKRLCRPVKEFGPDQVKMKPKNLETGETIGKLAKAFSEDESEPEWPKKMTQPEHQIQRMRLNVKLRAKKNLSGIEEENTEDVEDSFQLSEKNQRKAEIEGQTQTSRFHKKDEDDGPGILSFIDELQVGFDFQATTEIKKLVEKIRKNETDLESLFRLSSLILQNSRNLDCFEKCLLRIQAIDCEFKKKEISFALGKLNFMKHKWDKSLFHLKKNYNYSIKKDKALNYIVKILIKQRNFTKAKVACDKWIDLSPGNCRALYIKAKILYREHHFEEALTLFVRVVDQNLNHYKALLYLGFIKQVWDDRPDDAFVCFEGVVTNKFASSKFKSRAYYGLSVLSQEKNSTLSLQFMRSAIKYSPRDWALRKTLAGMYVRFRKFKRAISIYKVLLKDREEDLELLFALGTVYMIISEYLRAIKYFIRVVELSGKILEVKFDGLFADMFQSVKHAKSVVHLISNTELAKVVLTSSIRKTLALWRL